MTRPDYDDVYANVTKVGRELAKKAQIAGHAEAVK
jgi:hypothetical protein